MLERSRILYYLNNKSGALTILRCFEGFPRPAYLNYDQAALGQPFALTGGAFFASVLR